MGNLAADLDINKSVNGHIMGWERTCHMHHLDVPDHGEVQAQTVSHSVSRVMISSIPLVIQLQWANDFKTYSDTYTAFPWPKKLHFLEARVDKKQKMGYSYCYTFIFIGSCGSERGRLHPQLSQRWLYQPVSTLQAKESVLKVCDWRFGLVAKSFVITSRKAKESRPKSPDNV